MGQIEHRIRKLTIGSGIPKICVPVCGRTIPQVLDEAEKVSQSEADLMEWRLDYLDPMPGDTEWEDILAQVRRRLGDKPLLITYRTKQEGGAAREQISPEAYQNLYRAILEVKQADSLNPEAENIRHNPGEDGPADADLPDTGYNPGESGHADIDLIDIEYNLGEHVVRPVLEAAKKAGALRVLSYHNFRKTPANDTLLAIYREMETLGGDILKIAVMPERREDLLRMLQVSLQASREREHPVIAISMGEMGAESRICCEAIGSAVTFASLSQASAPGQIPVGKLRQVLETIHESH